MNESKEVLNDLKQESNTNQNIPGPGQGLPTKVSIKKPEININPSNEDLKDVKKGKLKKLFRNFKNDIEAYIKNQIEIINNQLKPLNDDLFQKIDNKYGGMYKVLIHQFLTKQETKIQNHEVTIAALKMVMFDECYGLYEATANIRNLLIEEGKEKEEIMPKNKYLESFELEFRSKKLEIEQKIQKALEDEAKQAEEANKKKEDKEKMPDENKESKAKESNNDVKESDNDKSNQETTGDQEKGTSEQDKSKNV